MYGQNEKNGEQETRRSEIKTKSLDTLTFAKNADIGAHLKKPSPVGKVNIQSKEVSVPNSRLTVADDSDDYHLSEFGPSERKGAPRNRNALRLKIGSESPYFEDKPYQNMDFKTQQVIENIKL